MLIDGMDISDGIKEYRKRLKKIIDTKSALNSIYCVNDIKEVLDSLSEIELKDLVLSYLRDSYYKSGSYKIGDKFFKCRLEVEEVYHCNATAFYPITTKGKKALKDDGKIERETFYYYDDSGYIYKSYVEILVVDDNSPDKTADLVEKYLDNKRVHLLKREKKEGLGPAYIAGFKHSFSYNPDYVIEMDADFSHDPNFVIKFIERMENEKLDLVIGSRYCNGISVVNWPLRRLFLSYYGNRYASFVLGSKIMDITGGFKCFRVSVLKNMNFDNILSTGYSFQIEMNYSFESNGYKVKEEPIIFYERRSGQSKMSKNIIAEALFRVLRLKFRNKKNYFNK